MHLMILILGIILFFSIAWFLAWHWFLRNDKAIAENAFFNACKAFDEGDYKKAKDILLNIKKGLVDGVNLKLGLIEIESGKYEEAKKYLEKALQETPKDLEVLHNLAKIEKILGNTDEAIELFNKITKQSPEDAESFLEIGVIHYEQDNYEKALEILEHAKDIAPEDVNVLFAIAKCKNALCDLENEEACQQLIDEYNQLSQYANVPKDFHISLAQLYAKTGQMDKALEYCKNALDNNQEDIEAYILLGLIQLIKKDFSSAKNSLSIALNFKPNNLETHNIFSYLLCQQEDDCKMQICRAKYYELIEKHLK